MTGKSLKMETATQAFYREVSELKPRLPKDWKLRFLLTHPLYDSYAGGVRLRLVMELRSTDPVVLEGLKTIVVNYEAEQEAAKHND